MVFGQKVVVGLVLMLMVLVGCGTGSVVDDSVDEHAGEIDTVDMSDSGVVMQSAPASADATVFAVTGENFKFVVDGTDNPDIRVKQGDTVRIEFTSTSGFHDWVVDEFNAKTAQVKAGGVTAVEFIADKTGTFEYYCSVGSHRANGMKGKLIVE